MPLAGILETIASIMLLGLFAQTLQIIYNYHGALEAARHISYLFNGGRKGVQGSIAIIPCRLRASSEDEIIYTIKSIRDLLSSKAVHKVILVVEPEDLEVLYKQYTNLLKDSGIEILPSDHNICRSCSGKNRALITAFKRICDLSQHVVILLDCDAYHHPKAVDLAVGGASYNGIIATGYRWYILRDIYGVLYNTISSLAFEYMGIERTRIAWGGLVAMPHKAIKDLGLIERFSEELSDDAVINIEARRRGYRVIFCPACISITPPPKGFKAFLSWAVRQMIILRLYTPKAFRFLVSVYLANTALLVVAIAAIASRLWSLAGILFLFLLIGYLALGLLRAFIAMRIYDPVSIYGDNIWGGERYIYRVIYAVLTAVRAPLVLSILIIAATARKFIWRGHLYCIKGGRAYPCQTI
jgi:cellulose synthase/poly-beta-1,6-N-acetylglucosamine synthase-like glycosyltransferase